MQKLFITYRVSLKDAKSAVDIHIKLFLLPV